MVVDGYQSTARETAVTSGVPQGTFLGPLFFLVYINDMHRNVSSKLRLFADDSLLYRKITKPEYEECCKTISTNFLEWAKRWQLKFNVAKCHTLGKRRSIRASKDQTSPVCKYYMEWELLSDVEHHPYLGVELIMIRRNFTIGTRHEHSAGTLFQFSSPKP